MASSRGIIKMLFILALISFSQFLIYQSSLHHLLKSISRYYKLNKDSVEYNGSNKQNTEEELWVPDWYNHTDVGGVLHRRLQTVRENAPSILATGISGKTNLE
ncbi:hypothetical protein EB796_022077 [Bugula neritina]|uniref:Uncharacterized protein n=1 Tax=Bugula neritina TaxID=10212 RepID=A0A7J7J1P9_BUGNE|nr:hypothetical protein EB796_022077 [Bugula neritina]